MTYGAQNIKGQESSDKVGEQDLNMLAKSSQLSQNEPEKKDTTNFES